MRQRVLALAAVLAAAPVGARAEGVAIEHSAVACLVAGQFPRVDACLRPAPAVARARVFFRPQGDAGWYYVEMAPAGACHAAALPRPLEGIVGTRVEYYVQATDRGFAEAQTETHAALVVRRAEDCRDRLIAPAARSGPSAVVPRVPAGFARASGNAAGVAAVIAGAAAAAGVAGALATDGDEGAQASGTASTTPASPAPATTLAPPPTTAPAGAGPNRPPSAVFRVSPDPPTGFAPLTVAFNMCGSTDPDGDALRFTFDFGDGATDRGGCQRSHTYTVGGAGAAAGAAGARASRDGFDAVLCVTDLVHPAVCHAVTVVASERPAPPPPPTPAPTPTPCPRTPPAVALTGPASTRPLSQAMPLALTASAAAAPGATVRLVEYHGLASPSNLGGLFGTSAAGPAYPASFALADAVALLGCGRFDFVEVKATALDTCGNRADSATRVYVINTCAAAACTATPACRGVPVPVQAGGRPLVWTSELAVPGAEGLLVLNEDAVARVGAGRYSGRAGGRAGRNVVALRLVDGAGRPGTWRLAIDGALAGSLEVLAGTPVLVEPGAVTLRFDGRPRERALVAFTAERTDSER